MRKLVKTPAGMTRHSGMRVHDGRLTDTLLGLDRSRPRKGLVNDKNQLLKKGWGLQLKPQNAVSVR